MNNFLESYSIRSIYCYFKHIENHPLSKLHLKKNYFDIVVRIFIECDNTTIHIVSNEISIRNKSASSKCIKISVSPSLLNKYLTIYLNDKLNIISIAIIKKITQQTSLYSFAFNI